MYLNSLKLDGTAKPKHENKIDQTLDFLKANYKIEINQYNPMDIRIKCLTKRYRNPNQISFSDLFLHIVQEEIPISRQSLKDIITSTQFMDEFNPIKEYFEGLRGKTDGTGHMDRLIAHLKPTDFGDKKNGYYLERMIKLMRKWFVATVACSLNVRYNEVMLGFVAEREGMGKTLLAEFLCPPELKTMFQKAEKDRKAFQFSHAFHNNFLILFDEFVRLNNRTAEEFKQTLTQNTFRIKKDGEPFYMQITRVGSGLFTTNNKTGNRKGFLTPALGTRRFGTIQLDDINRDFLEKVDINQVWAEAFEMYESGFDYGWNDEDFKELKEYNQRFMIHTVETNFIEAYVSHPKKNDEGKWMMASEIVKVLKRQCKVPREVILSPPNVGIAMSQLGFKRQGKRQDGKSRYRYFVKITPAKK